MPLSVIHSAQIIAFGCSCITLSRSFRDIRQLFYIMLITLIAESLGWYLFKVKLAQNYYVYNTSVPLIIFLLLHLFYTSLDTGVFKRLVKAMAIFYLAFITVNLTLIQGAGSFSTYNYMAGGLVASTASVLYLIELIRMPKLLDLKTEPVFWVCVGVLLMYIPKCVLYSVYEFMLQKNSFTTTFGETFSRLNTILSVTFYVSISIACTCRLMFQRSPKLSI